MYDTISTILIRWLKSKSYIRSNNNFISRGMINTTLKILNFRNNIGNPPSLRRIYVLKIIYTI